MEDTEFEKLIGQYIKRKADRNEWMALGFDEFQCMEINRGLDNGVDVSIYCNPEFNAASMKSLRLGLE